MADIIKFHSDIDKTLTKYIDETSAHIKTYENETKAKRGDKLTAALYNVRLEQYYALKEIQNLLKIHFH